ncbi:D-fructose-6-phosphate amidotransferase [Saccharobesus litoralis]|uniref:D-fructose-6-phosphate amidotransferase n=1 Tax=Saccharobesus litoralis TaxID=2172099 RepID=A0A2S0VNC5_9ALTE|nr:LnmK family bifunctional acyltransferase/decarboxylase [Saccharobesus litoralis]AWB65706.1 D-fructose-6-phosphate amidotransferase [Saccharobesus litoralis]
MLVENVELTMSHLGLGDLNEYALMVLFGNAHSHHLVRGLSITPNDIQAMDGTTLYPAYFMTHLKVPLTQLLPSIKLWDKVSVGVDVRKFGDTLLESDYVIASEGQVPDDLEQWQSAQFITMAGNNLLVAEEINGGGTKRQVLNPNPDKITELVKARRSPAGIAQSRKVRAANLLAADKIGEFTSSQPYIYSIAKGRDAMPGHAMIFAKFSEVMDLAEADFLAHQIEPGIADGMLSHLNILEREIYYYGNCYAGEELAVYLAGNIESVEDDELSDDLDFVAAAFLNIRFEIYQKRTGTLIAMAKAKKVFAVPMQEQDLIPDLVRKINQLNQPI